MITSDKNTYMIGYVMIMVARDNNNNNKKVGSLCVCVGGGILSEDDGCHLWYVMISDMRKVEEGVSKKDV